MVPLKTLQTFHERGIPIGVYWYICEYNAKVAEAKKCLEIIKGKTISYPVFIDTEDNYHHDQVARKPLPML